MIGDPDGSKNQKTARQPATPKKRWHRITKAGYYRAEKRSFEGGDPAKDGLEAAIAAQLAGGKKSGSL